MVSRLLARAGIDAVQWRALFVAGLKLDFRTPGVTEGGVSGIQRFLAIGVMNAVLGLALGAIAVFVPDVFVSGSLVLTVAMVLVAASVVMEFAVVVISPLDYDVLGYQPISSPTYLAARLANVLFYTTLITTTLALLPMLAFFFARGFNPILGFSAVAATYFACLTTTLAMVALYVATARRVHPQRLRRVLTYVQLVTSFTVYGGYLLLPQVFRPEVLQHWTVRKSAWMLLYPPTWFASYLELAVGHWSATEIAPALASICVLGGLVWLVAARLSLDYSEMLSRQVAQSERQRRSSARSRSWMGRGERRAVALLVRAQFRHDQRFRLGVLSMAPLSIFYLLMTLRDNGLVDPFAAGSRGLGGSMLIYFAVLFLPTMLLMAVGRSDAFRASWIFHVTPARRASLVLAAKDLAVGYLLVPYLALLAIVLSYFFHSATHAFLHMFVQGLIANLLLLAVVAVEPDLPFSKPVQKGQFTAGFFAVMLVGSLAQLLSSVLLSTVVYPSPALTALVIVTLLVAGICGQALLRRRLERTTATMEFLV